METKLPKQTTDIYTNDFRNYSKQLLKLHELETWGDDQNIIDCVEPLANHFNLSLRQLEKVFTILALFYGSSAKNYLRLIPVLVFLAIIKTIKPDLFEKLLHKKITYSEICQKTGLNHKEEEHRKLYSLMSWVRFCLLTKKEFNELDDNDRIKGFEQYLWSYNIERESLIPYFSRRLNMYVSNY